MKEFASMTPIGNRFTRRFIWAVVPLLSLVVVVGFLPMTLGQQAGFGGLIVCFAFVIGRLRSGRLATLILVLLSMCTTARYAVWRVNSVGHYFTSPWQPVNPWSAVLMLLLLGAELYSFLILFLGYMQSVAPLRRPPLSLPEDIDKWPTVDLMIPTVNEPLEIVRTTVLAAKQIDWPEEKLSVWLLDDGDRAEFRAFAEEAGIKYVARLEHKHAKAGNINNALRMASGDLVAILDCDHVPTRSFLQVAAGWFLQDDQLAMLQTPHHFYSPDPFERSLGHFRSMPNESELFYGVIQDTNDFWNATFFCGSCAVLRRSALDDVGGIASDTVTEDAHTSLLLQQQGWNTAYINLVQASGLATETLSDHVKQRIRWARGMAQILRIDNPLFSRNLTLPQRLCYFNAMLHFMYALPRLIFLTAPILYLILGVANMPGYWLMILAFALPHLALATLANSRIQGFRRYSFWSEIYETVLSPYILLPSFFALVSSRQIRFNVTAKGQSHERDYFDAHLARPFLVLIALNGLALLLCVPRYLYWNQGHTGAIVMNATWTIFNIVVLSIALSMCRQVRQRRRTVRVATTADVELQGSGTRSAGSLNDLSIAGASVTVRGRWWVNDKVRIAFQSEHSNDVLSAHVVDASQNNVRLAFDLNSLEELETITRILHSKPDRWLDWADGRTRDNVVKSFLSVCGASAVGCWHLLRPTKRDRGIAARSVAGLSARTVGVLLAMAALFFFLRSVRGESVPAGSFRAERSAEVKQDVNFGEMNSGDSIHLDANTRSRDLRIDLPSNLLITAGTLHLKYTLPESGERNTTLEVLLNDTVLAAITPSRSDFDQRHGEEAVPIPAELLVRRNRLTLRLADANAGRCGLAQNQNSAIDLDAASSLSLTGDRLILANDLSLLPEPFLQRTGAKTSDLQFVFGHQPTSRTLEAAGVLASWVGTQVPDGSIHFPVSIESVPKGNALVMVLGQNDLTWLPYHADGSAHIEVMANPTDAYSKLLVLFANSPDEMLVLAQALASNQLKLTGDRATLGAFALPPPRWADDAPRWINANRVSLESLNDGEPIRAVNSTPWIAHLRLAPDLRYGQNRDIYLHLEYGNDAQKLDPTSNLSVRLNGVSAESLPIVAAAERVKSQQANLYLGDLPVSDFGNTLQAQFFFTQPSSQNCIAPRTTGSLGSGSYLDLGNPVHLAQLPNLHLFSISGFPYTRFADLSQTVVMIPARAVPEQMSLYLDILGYFAMQTGYPALRVQVTDSVNGLRSANKDVLMLGTFDDLRNTVAVNSSLPLSIGESGWQLSARARWMEMLKGSIQRLRSDSSDQTISQDESTPDGVLEQIESPFNRDRSLVVILGRDAQTLNFMKTALLAEFPKGNTNGTLSIWEGGKFTSHDYSTASYYVSDTGLSTRIKRAVLEYPLILIFVLVGAVLLLSVWLNACIRSRIHERLLGVDFDLDGNPNSPNSNQTAIGAEAS